MDWLNLFAVPGTLKSLLQHHSSKALVLWHSSFLQVKVKWKLLSRVWLFVPHGLYNPWNSPGQNTGVGSLSLLQGIFPTQESNQGLLHWRWFLYQLSHQGSPDPHLPLVAEGHMLHVCPGVLWVLIVNTLLCFKNGEIFAHFRVYVI